MRRSDLQDDKAAQLAVQRQRRQSVTIAGGYNPAYNGAGSDTVIAGSIVVKSGMVIFDEVRVR